MSKSTSKNIGFLAGVGVLMVALIGGGIVLTKNIGKSNREVTRENAITQLDKRLKKIQVFETQPRKAAVEIAETNLAAELPDINKYPLSVTGRPSSPLTVEPPCFLDTSVSRI